MRTEIKHIEDKEDQENTGWWVLYFDDGEDTSFDAIGPFDTEAEALEALNDC
jgi:hypothetical protein